MSKYINNSLREDETVIIKARKSLWYLIWPAVCLAAVVITLIVLTPKLTALADTVKTNVPFVDNMLPTVFKYVLPALLWLVFGLLAFVPFCKHLITFLTLQLVLTDKRLISRVGLFHIRSLDIPVEKLDHIEVRTSLLGNWFHSYDVEIASVSGANGVIKGRKKSIRTFCGISNAQKMREALQSLVEQHAARTRVLQAQEIANAMHSF